MSNLEKCQNFIKGLNENSNNYFLFTTKIGEKNGLRKRSICFCFDRLWAWWNGVSYDKNHIAEKVAEIFNSVDLNSLKLSDNELKKTYQNLLKLNKKFGKSKDYDSQKLQPVIKLLSKQLEQAPGTTKTSQDLATTCHPGTILDNHYISIKNAYDLFLKTKDISNLNDNISSFEEIEKTYESMYRVDKQKAALIKKDLDSAKEMIQQMNANGKFFTKHDAKGINSFFKKPIEETYTDTDGTVYIQPDHSNLFRFGGKFFLLGGYRGLGLGRHQKINGSLCDILYLNKEEDQIEFESKNKQYIKQVQDYIFKGNCEEPYFHEPEQTFFDRFFTRTKNDKYISELIKVQFNEINESLSILNEKCQEWKYESFKVCAEGELRDFGLDKAAKKIHAILFYFKKID